MASWSVVVRGGRPRQPDQWIGKVEVLHPARHLAARVVRVGRLRSPTGRRRARPSQAVVKPPSSAAASTAAWHRRAIAPCPVLANIIPNCMRAPRGDRSPARVTPGATVLLAVVASRYVDVAVRRDHDRDGRHRHAEQSRQRNALALDVMLELTDVLARDRRHAMRVGVVLGRRGPGVLGRARLRRHARRIDLDDARRPVRGVHDDDEHGPVDPAGGDRQGARPGHGGGLPAGRLVRPGGRRRVGRVRPSGWQGRAVLPHAARWRWPARSAASGRSRWRSPATPSRRRPLPSGD